MAEEVSELALLAGGDESELAVMEIRRSVTAAWGRLFAEHPLFHPNNEEMTWPTSG